jgi:ABC-type branched-subunit amino acid transport system substrate-binding protein
LLQCNASISYSGVFSFLFTFLFLFHPRLKMNKILYALLVVSLLWSCKSTDVLRRDLQTQSLVEEGKSLLNKGKYAEAATVLEGAAVRPANQSTSTALYLAGVAYFKAKKEYPAEQQFTRLIRAFPKSKYVYEAKYHRALLLLKKYDEMDQQEGLETLFRLSADRRRGSLAKDADQALRHFVFYDAKASFLQDQFQRAVPAQRQLLAEALAYQLVNSKQIDGAKAVYEALKSKSGESEFLKKMLGDATGEEIKPADPDKDYYKIALFLPLFLDDYSYIGMEELPAQSADALEFWEGFRMAIEEFSASSEKKIYTKVFDTRKSDLLIGAQLEELKVLKPDLIVGEIFTGPSATIAQWAAKNQMPQLVPFSSNPELLKDSSGFTFMARPAYETHGRRMAEHAFNTLGLKKVGVWTDQRNVTEAIANAFIETFEELGGGTERFPIDSVFEDRAQDDVLDHFDDINLTDSLDGMYVPLSLEETAGLIISTMQIEYVDQEEMVVMGTPSWGRFPLIGQREKDRFRLTYTTPFSELHDSLAVSMYETAYQEVYGKAPEGVSIQGYGLGKYVASVLARAMIAAARLWLSACAPKNCLICLTRPSISAISKATRLCRSFNIKKAIQSRLIEKSLEY